MLQAVPARQGTKNHAVRGAQLWRPVPGEIVDVSPVGLTHGLPFEASGALIPIMRLSAKVPG